MNDIPFDDRLQHKNRLVLGDRPKCLFWDFSRLRWSGRGCSLVEVESDRDSTVCQCNHLTNFAAIMDLSGRETDSYEKNIVTQIFCSLSVFSLILNIILITKTNLVFKVLKQNPTKSRRDENEISKLMMKKRNLIVLNQSACLLVSDIIIMTGMDATYNKV